MTEKELDKIKIDIQKYMDKNGDILFKEKYNAFVERNKKEQEVSKEIEHGEMMEKKLNKNKKDL